MLATGLALALSLRPFALFVLFLTFALFTQGVLFTLFTLGALRPFALFTQRSSLPS